MVHLDALSYLHRYVWLIANCLYLLLTVWCWALQPPVQIKCKWTFRGTSLVHSLISLTTHVGVDYGSSLTCVSLHWSSLQWTCFAGASLLLLLYMKPILMSKMWSLFICSRAICSVKKCLPWRYRSCEMDLPRTKQASQNMLLCGVSRLLL